MNIAKYIDHTMLKPDATSNEILQLCEEAKKYGFASVCVNEFYTDLVSKALNGSDVHTCTVIGFPLGANDKEVKAFETFRAIKAGADEIDMVINIGALKDKNYEYVESDIHGVVEAANGKTVKVILETCLLNEEEIIKACHIAIKAGAHFVKTSTGFSSRGATINDVIIMKKNVDDKVKIKASGGIHNYYTAIAMIEAGADRIGTSSGLEIIKENI